MNLLIINSVPPKMAVFLLLFTLILALGIYWYYKQIKREKFVSAIPGPKPYPIIGSVLELIFLDNAMLFRYARKMVSDYGPIYRWWLGPVLTVNIANPPDIEVITSSSKHISKGVVYNSFQAWLGTGLLTSDGTKWHMRRKMLTPTFHFSILQQFLNTFTEQTALLVKDLEKECTKPYTCVDEYVTNFTLNSICETAMGTNLKTRDKQHDTYRQSIFEMGQIIVYKNLRPWLLNNLIYMMSPKYWAQEKLVKTLHAFSRNIISKRKENFNMYKEGDNVESYSQKKRLAMLDLLLTAKAEGADIDDEGIREEVDTFTFEGHDTTSACLCFTLMLFACNPEEQEKVVAEMEEVFGDSEELPSYSDIQKLSYLEMCIKESLRLYPSVPYIQRMTSEEVKTHSGYTIPANTVVPIHIYDVHHNAELYPDPEKFIPERFSLENSKNRHPYAYLPFSAGPRNCIGQRFAMLELKTVLSGILRKFKLEPIDRPSDITLKVDLVLRATREIRVKFTMRNK